MGQPAGFPRRDLLGDTVAGLVFGAPTFAKALADAGTQVYREQDALKFTVDHSESQAHRPAFGNEWGVARLPIGKILLTPAGELFGARLRLDLWNAELSACHSTRRVRSRRSRSLPPSPHGRTSSRSP